MSYLDKGQNPGTKLGSHLFRISLRFVLGGFTAGGASEYVLPDLDLETLVNLVKRIIE